MHRIATHNLVSKYVSKCVSKAQLTQVALHT